MADDNAMPQELEESGSITDPVAPAGTAPVSPDAPVAEPTNADDEQYFKISRNPDYDEVRSLLEDERIRHLAKSALGRSERAQEAEVAKLRAELEQKDQELLITRFNALPPERQQLLREANPDLNARLQRQPVNPEIVRTQAVINSQFNAVWDELAARGIPQERIAEIQRHGERGSFGNGHPLEQLENLRQFVTTRELPYWASQRNAQRQQAAPAANPVSPTPAASPVAQTNPGLRAAGPDSQRGTPPPSGKTRISDIRDDDLLTNWKPGDLIRRAHNGELLPGP